KELEHVTQHGLGRGEDQKAEQTEREQPPVGPYVFQQPQVDLQTRLLAGFGHSAMPHATVWKNGNGLYQHPREKKGRKPLSAACEGRRQWLLIGALVRQGGVRRAKHLGKHRYQQAIAVLTQMVIVDIERA